MLEQPTVSLDELIRRLSRSAGAAQPGLPVADVLSSPRISAVRQRADLIVAPNEISMTHGTGVLLSRMLETVGPFVTFRTWNNWGGRQDVQPLADFVLRVPGDMAPTRSAIAERVSSQLRDFDIDYILAVPYFREDVLAALAAKAATGAPLAVYVMDDNCIYGDGIPEQELAELLGLADALFAISPEMRTAYQNRFRRKFWVLPPLVADRLLREEPSAPYAAPADAPVRAVMIGNVWDQGWLDLLWNAIKESTIELTWFVSHDQHNWLTIPPESERAGRFLVERSPPPADLAIRVAAAAFAIVPSGTFTESGHTSGIAHLSLPSRMPFIVATSGTPILVLGHPGTCAARFVERFGIGLASPYELGAVTHAARVLADPGTQTQMRERAAALAPVFRASGAYALVKDAARAGGVLPDSRFEPISLPRDGEFGYHIPSPVSRSVIADQVDMVRAFQRIHTSGYRPDFVLDVGASSGIWSYTLFEVFPDARYVLVDPLFKRYSGSCLRPGFEVIECAVADQEGSLEIQISDDLYNSSLLAVGSAGVHTETAIVPVQTIDTIFREKNLSGRGILKLDVQFAEHLALAGAMNALASHIDIVVLELTLDPPVAEAKNLREILEIMSGFGFEYHDEVGEWRNAATGRLEQKDVLFAHRGFPAPTTHETAQARPTS